MKLGRLGIYLGICLVAVAIVAGTSAIRRGLSARTQPLALEVAMARALRHLAVPASAQTQSNPFRATPELLSEARRHFADHCAGCHANDGSGKTAMGQNLYPKSPDMRLSATQQLSDGELYYMIHNGIRFTGMPAWGAEGQDDDSWKLVLFIRHLPHLTVEELKEMEKYNPKSETERVEEKEEEDFLNGNAVNPHEHHK